MLEQQLINAFMKLAAKAGAGSIIRDLLRSVDENGNPKSWTPAEMEHAINFLNEKVENFGHQDAIVVIKTLIRKFNIDAASLGVDQDEFLESDELSGVQGLQ
ncbi:MAG TPA: hypothetical protein VEB86_01085 [Chryseosolibacter sp.]|nr:hypothetical protein [Chryseosolibacter sp.]